MLNQYKPIQTVARTVINCLALKLLFIDKHYEHRASENAVGEAPPLAARQSSAADPISLRPSPGPLSSITSLAHTTLLPPLLAPRSHRGPQQPPWGSAEDARDAGAAVLDHHRVKEL